MEPSPCKNGIEVQISNLLEPSTMLEIRKRAITCPKTRESHKEPINSEPPVKSHTYLGRGAKFKFLGTVYYGRDQIKTIFYPKKQRQRTQNN